MLQAPVWGPPRVRRIRKSPPGHGGAADAQLVHLHPRELPLLCHHRFLLVVAAEDLPICRQVFLFCSLHLLFLDDQASVLEAVLEAGGGSCNAPVFRLYYSASRFYTST